MRKPPQLLTSKMSEFNAKATESEPLTQEEKIILRENLKNKFKIKKKLYNIHDRSEQFGIIFWLVSFTSSAFTMIMLFAAVYGAFDPPPIDPEPINFVDGADAFEPGYRYELFNVSLSYNESRRICAKRKGELPNWNNSLEHSRFNTFVDPKFKDFIAANTDEFRRRGLQMWTGTTTIFKGNKKLVFDLADWPLKVPKPQKMIQFYKEPTEKRLCLSTSKERNDMYSKAMQSKFGIVAYVVKDFTGKFRNDLREVGCWNIRIIEEGQTLELPFACKINATL